MKATRRFMSALIAVMMIVSTFTALPAFAEFSDLAKENDAYEAVDVLNKLGIINGYEEDGVVKFKPENNVTRAEFTAMLLRTRGMGAVGSTSLENPPFPDVVTPDVSWAIGNIRTARELKIINGYDDGTFKPNNNVSYEEAIKMIVCALGYGEMGADGAFWYTRYLNTATSLGFLDGAGGAVATPATRATIAKMLYNCLEIKLAENNAITDKTILENDLKLTKNVGYIDANPEISLSKPDSNLRANEVQIAVNTATGVVVDTYKVENADEYKDMLGAKITFYYTFDRAANLKHLIMARVENSQTVEIEASNLYDFSSNGIEYLRSADSSRTTNASIAPNNVVVYNDKLYGANVANSSFAVYCSEMGADAMPKIGKVKLLDRDNDGYYDVVFIDSYDAWIVSSKSTSNYTIVDNVLRKELKDESGNLKDAEGKPYNQIVLNPDDTVFYDASGNTSSFASISVGGVVCVKSSNAENGGDLLQTAIVCNNTVSGKVSGTRSDGTITIGEKNYKSSRLAPWKNAISGANPDRTAPSMGDSGKFYLDCDGNILAFDKSEIVSNQQYGYITVADTITNNFESETKMYIVTKANPKGKLYTISDNVKLDGSPTNSILGDLNLGNGKYYQLIKFTTDTKGKVDEIITVTETEEKQAATEDALYQYSEVSKDDNMEYSSSGKQLIHEDTGEKIYIGSAIIFKVPTNRENYGDFRLMSVSDFVKDQVYNVEVFDVSAAGTAKVVLVYGIPEGAAIGGVKPDSPVMFITEVPEEGEDSRYTIRGLVGGNVTSYQLSITDTKTVAVAPELKKGDLVRVAKDDEGYYITEDKYVIFKTDDGYREEAIEVPDSDNNDDSYPKEERITGSVKYKVVWGNVSELNSSSEERFIIELPEGGVCDEIQKSYFSGAKIFEIDTNKDEMNDDYIIDRTDDGYANVLEELQPGKEIFVHMTGSSKVQTLIIVQR